MTTTHAPLTSLHVALWLLAIVASWSQRVGADDRVDYISSIALRNRTGEYWSVGPAEGADGAPLLADESRIGRDETFRLSAVVEPGRLRSSCFRSGASVRVSTKTGRPWALVGQQVRVVDRAPDGDGGLAIFTLINQTDASRCVQYGDTVSLLSAKDRYLSASPGGVVDADQKISGEWERFVLVDPLHDRL